MKRYCYFMAITLYPEMPPPRVLYRLEEGDSYYERQINQTSVAPERQGDSVGAGYYTGSYCSALFVYTHP